jgi:hypothetical protein
MQRQDWNVLPEGVRDHILSMIHQGPRGGDTVSLSQTSKTFKGDVHRVRGQRVMQLYMGLHHMPDVLEQVCSRLGSRTSVSLLVNEVDALYGDTHNAQHNRALDALFVAAEEAKNRGKPVPLQELLINSHTLFWKHPHLDNRRGAYLAPFAVHNLLPNLQRLGFTMAKATRGDAEDPQVLKMQRREVRYLERFTGLTSLVMVAEEGRAASGANQHLLPTTLRKLALQGDFVVQTRALEYLVDLRELWLRAKADRSYPFEQQQSTALLGQLERLALSVRYFELDWFSPEARSLLASRLVDLELVQVVTNNFDHLRQLSGLTSLTALRLRQPVKRLGTELKTPSLTWLTKKGMVKPSRWYDAKHTELQDLADSLQQLPSLSCLGLPGCKAMAPVLNALSGCCALQQLRLEKADPWLLYEHQYLTRIKHLTRLELRSSTAWQQPPPRKGPERWDLSVERLTGLVYLELAPDMLVAGPDHTWVSKLTCLHTLALTEYKQLAPRGNHISAWVPTSPARRPRNVQLLQRVKMALRELAASVCFLVLHAYNSEEVVEALRTALPWHLREEICKQVQAQVLIEPRNRSWMRAISF